jgi:Domain of unknown function (DUF4832)
MASRSRTSFAVFTLFAASCAPSAESEPADAGTTSTDTTALDNPERGWYSRKDIVVDRDFATAARVVHSYVRLVADRPASGSDRISRPDVRAGLVTRPRRLQHGSLAELAAMHFTYLNQDFHPDAVQAFKNGGCFDEISRRLGYRLWVKTADIPDSAPAGSTFQFRFVVQNDGFAAPLYDRPVYVVFDSGSGQPRKVALSGLAPTSGQPGETTVSVPFTIPSDLTTGPYRFALLAVRQDRRSPAPGRIRNPICERRHRHFLLGRGQGLQRPPAGSSDFPLDMNGSRGGRIGSVGASTSGSDHCPTIVRSREWRMGNARRWAVWCVPHVTYGLIGRYLWVRPILFAGSIRKFSGS